MASEAERLESLVTSALDYRQDEITCDEWVEQVGGYVEKLAEGGAVPAALEVVAHHTKICPQCAEELEALRDALELPTDS